MSMPFALPTRLGNAWWMTVSGLGVERGREP